MTFSVTPQGIETPLLPQARERVVALWRARYGTDAQTSSDTPDGLLIDLLALLLTLVWEGNADVYGSAYLRTAGGVSLDLLLDLFGRIRLPARASTATLVLYGTDATAISPGTVASVDGTGRRFGTDAAVTLGAADTTFVALVKTANNAQTYTVEVNATTFAVVATPSSTRASIAAALALAINSGAEPVEAFVGGLDGDGFARLCIFADDPGETVTTPDASTQVQVYPGARVGVTAEQTGPLVASAGLLDIIETPVTGLVGVTTTADAIVGRNVETDPEFRARHIDTLRSSGLGTPLAIRDRVLERVPTVLAARVFENRTEAVDARGLPPHSFEVVALSEPITAPEDGEAIAAEILASKPAGIESVGDTLYQLDPPQGFGPQIPIGVTRPTVGYLHLRVTLTPGEGFPSSGDPAAAVVSALAEFLRFGAATGLRLGTDLVRFQLGEPINEAVPGVQSALVETAQTATPGGVPTFANADIDVDDDAVLIADTSRIEVLIA